MKKTDDFYEDENCGHCRYHKKDDEEWICTNPDSDCFGCYTEYHERCVDFSERNSFQKFSVELRRRNK